VDAPRHHAVAAFAREARLSRHVVLASSGADRVPVIGAAREWFARTSHRRLEHFFVASRSTRGRSSGHRSRVARDLPCAARMRRAEEVDVL